MTFGPCLQRSKESLQSSRESALRVLSESHSPGACRQTRALPPGAPYDFGIVSSCGLHFVLVSISVCTASLHHDSALPWCQYSAK
eukprot:CAMPEP_0168706692 /NCGR_PEP_ID=MMETSP0503-20121227/40720_1 /TAXON_ID=89963 /ORGANISM="Heterocapsa rotundata, Strain SCCAP K-0483" /LENGTH=84 /DNA_ID=CAMNT_0008752935 /DNA_START=182 /DNA_END=433 /DNA_ORIENTATION=-